MLISIEDITLQIGGQSAFAGTTWQINEDQRWALIGATASGKSLLAAAICQKVRLLQGRIRYGFASPERTFLKPGEILLFSAESHQAFLRRHAGYHQARWQSLEGADAPDVSSLLSLQSLHRRSPYEVAPTPPAENIPAFQQRRQQLIALFALENLLQRRLVHLSHGESRKVWLARLLLQSPAVLILDNPYLGLDEVAVQTLRRAVEHLLAEGSPDLLLLTSRLEDLPDGITHLAVVKDMRLARQGPKEEVLRNLPQDIGTPAAAADFPDGPNRAVLARQIEQFAARLDSRSIPGEVLVDLQDVSVAYSEMQILQNITWMIRRGERWALSGPNGAGKSTLLSLILADNPQGYQNAVTLFGRRRGSGESIWEIKRRIGWVAPELQIYYHQRISALAVVCSGYFDSVGLYRRCSEPRQQAARDWLTALGILPLADRPLDTLSAGQQRLVLLARALVKSPDLLVLDEPCQGLDNLQRQHFLGLLDELCRRTPLTMIYVTHEKNEVPAAVNRHLRLQEGRMVALK